MGIGDGGRQTTSRLSHSWFFGHKPGTILVTKTTDVGVTDTHRNKFSKNKSSLFEPVATLEMNDKVMKQKEDCRNKDFENKGSQTI
jgi:hypothetical protein